MLDYFVGFLCGLGSVGLVFVFVSLVTLLEDW